MSIKRFVAPNGREAMAQVRRELGDDALVLSTKKLTGGRIEVLALGPDEAETMIEDAHCARAASARTSPSAAPVMQRARVHAPDSGTKTETFERFLQRQAQLQGQRQSATVKADVGLSRARGAASYSEIAATPHDTDEYASAAPASVEAPAPSVMRRRPVAATVTPSPSPAPDLEQPSAAVSEPAPGPMATAAQMPVAATTPAVAAIGPAADARLLAELQSMRALMLEQMATMGAAHTAAELHRKSPMQVRAMTRMLTAGFSPSVSRKFGERAPAAATPADTDRWLQDVLALNVRCADAESEILTRGGVFALVGPTGVGKTTTVAKLAARFAMQHGAQALGLITLDAYRVGAQEQLRTYGRILGVPVFQAQDMITLRELIASMASKRLVLIDTCGVSQRDERLHEVLAMLDEAGAGHRRIERVLLLNAASHAETLDDVARAWKADQCAGAILTKLDEAVRLGGALDCVLRRKLTVLGATNGQRVPEDWLAADRQALASAALKPGAGCFAMAEGDAAVLISSSRVTAATAG